MALVRAEPPMAGADFARVVSPREMTVHGSGDGPRIAAIDTGIKSSIVRHLVERGAVVELHPCATSAEDLLAGDPDAIFLANGPGDPAALDYIVAHAARAGRGQAGVRHLPRPPAAVPRRRPGDVQAAVRPPRRQPPGQGPASPARSRSPRRTTASRCSARTASGRSPATSRCAGRPTSAPPQLSHINLYDRTVEGLTLLDVAGGTVQYHPEAGPGPERQPLPLRPLPRPDRARPPPDAAARRHPAHPHPRLGPDRHRPGGRVRLLRRAGLQGPQGGGLRGRARQLQPGDDHDRPRVRRRDVRRAAAGRPGARRSSRASGPTRCCRRSAARRR